MIGATIVNIAKYNDVDIFEDLYKACRKGIIRDYWFIQEEKPSNGEIHYHGFLDLQMTIRKVQQLKAFCGNCTFYLYDFRYCAKFKHPTRNLWRWYKYCMKNQFSDTTGFAKIEQYSTVKFQSKIHTSGLHYWHPDNSVKKISLEGPSLTPPRSGPRNEDKREASREDVQDDARREE